SPAAAYVWLPVTVPGLLPGSAVIVPLEVAPSPQLQVAVCVSPVSTSVKLPVAVTLVLTFSGSTVGLHVTVDGTGAWFTKETVTVTPPVAQSGSGTPSVV